MRSFLLVFFGGGLGSVLRYSLGLIIKSPGFLVIGTLLANASAALLLGVVLAQYEAGRWNNDMRLWLGVGFCGGLSTFSTFSAESLRLLQQDQPWTFALHAVSHLVVSLAMVWVGMKLVST
jgi:fluoride exporter